MKPVALDPHGIEATRDRQEPRHTRQAVVKRRVKTSHLWQLRITSTERLDQFNFAR